MNQQARIRWRCRRGMLELDIVLLRFMDNHYAQLDARQRELFEVLLTHADHDLWNMISGKLEAPDQAFQPILKLLQEN